MSLSTAIGAIKSRWVSQWGNTTPTAYENSIYNAVPGTSWVRLTVRPGASSQISLGAPSLDRHAGIVFVQIFTPLSQGAERSNWLADRAIPVFRKVNLNASDCSVTFHVPYSISAETGGDDWFQVNVLCPYTLDEVT